MKKILTLLLVVAMIFGTAACGSGGNDTPSTPDETISDDDDGSQDTPEPADTGSAEAKTVKVGVSIYLFDDNFMTLYRQEIANYFKTLETDEVKYDVMVVDAKNDMAEQSNQVDTFLAQGVDVLIINLVQSSSASTITQKADAANVPVVYINREPDEGDMNASDNICYVGADASQSGTYQGEIILETPNKGDIDGDGVIRYVMIMGDPENVDARLRTEYSIKALTDAGMEVENLFEQRGDWQQSKGEELAATALTQHGDKIDVIFCNNDGMALGAYQAIKNAGRVVNEDIYLVGVDALDEVVEMVEAGEMTGTVLNDHVGQAHAAVDAAIRYVNNESNEKINIVNYQKVTKD